MSAITKIAPPIIKPRDLVITPSGRLAKVLEILPHHMRLIQWLEGEPGHATLCVDDLRLWQEGKVRRWAEHVLPDLATATKVKPLDERMK